MKRLRTHPLFLLVIALLLPLGISLLFYDFHSDNNLVSRKQISTADDWDLLSFLRKNPRIFVAADIPFLAAGMNLPGIKAFHYINPDSTAWTGSVLRC